MLQLDYLSYCVRLLSQLSPNELRKFLRMPPSGLPKETAPGQVGVGAAICAAGRSLTCQPHSERGRQGKCPSVHLRCQRGCCDHAHTFHAHVLQEEEEQQPDANAAAGLVLSVGPAVGMPAPGPSSARLLSLSSDSSTDDANT